jgi:Secretion system C-terminal sorting domain
MVKNIVLLLLMFCFYYSNAQLNVNWQQLLEDGTTGEEYSEIMLHDSTGFIYSIGRVIPLGQTRSDIIIAKYDEQGSEIWRTIWGGPSGKGESIKAAALDLNGDLILCGEYFNASNLNDILVMKYSSTGQLQWLDTIDGTSQLYDQGKGVCVDDANNYYFTGYSLSGTYRAKLVKYTPAGQRLWTKFFTGTQQGLGLIYHEKSVYLNCMTGVTGSPSHAMLLKLDTAGQVIASITLNSFVSDFISKILIKEDKIYLLDVQSLGPNSGSHYGVVCIDTTMQLMWNRSYSIGYVSDPVGLCVFDSMIYVAHTKYQSAALTSPEVELRGIQRLTGDSLFLAPLIQVPGIDYNAQAMVVDSTGNITLIANKDIAAPNSWEQFYLVRWNYLGVQTSSFLLSDTAGFGQISLIQPDPNTIYLGASIYNSQFTNSSISTWRLNTAPVGLQSMEEYPWTLAPNPAQDFIRFIELPSGKYNYVIYTMSGQVIQKGKLSEGQRQIEINLETGMYFIRIESKNFMSLKKFVVN